MRARLGQERGWALMTTVLVMAILMSLALPLLTMVDTQQAGSSAERRSEGSFNVADAVLNASVFILSDHWPTDSSRYPRRCTASSTDALCPDADLVTGTYQGADYDALAWSIQVRDDAGSEYYEPSEVDPGPWWDANENDKVWVRVDARAAEGSRSVVALVKTVKQIERFPRQVVTAGRFQTTNNGNKVIVDTLGDAAEPAPIAVRCTQPAPSSSCLGYDPAKNQVSPELVEPGYTGATAVPASVLNGYRERAKSLGTYYADSCPSSPVGTLIFIEEANCTYGGGGQANSLASPGMLIVGAGSVHFGGSFEFYGIVYAANLQRSSDNLVTLSGTSEITGSVAVDGAGGVSVGSSGRNITYADLSFADVLSTLSVGIVHGTWRELPGGAVDDSRWQELDG